MLNLPDYQETNQIYTGTKTLVYRAIRGIDGQPVIIKVLRNHHPNVNELVKFRNQYLLTRELEHPLLVQPLALEDYGNGYALVMKDEGEISLWDYWQEHPRSLTEFLAIAIQLSEVLHYLSQKRIIHKDIKPSNILIHPETRLVKLIDFSISSVLPKEQQQLINPNLLEGTLAYISPEQTGRMNRGIDYRTDFYSLGVTFFELLTGSLPFTTRDPMELVHCHIAQAVEFPSSSEQSVVPEMIQKIVLKLMAKNAEHRYQSALGLKHDLERCEQQLQATGEINPFQLGSRDLCDRFIIPEKLYGREREVQTLLDAFGRVANGTTEMMLVAGFSGIGKTAVVNEVHKPIVKQRGYFIKGKFDQFNRNIPFSAFVQAFRDLMGQLLGESDEELAIWKRKILAAVGENGQRLIEVIPELELIIGKQPAVPELPDSAARNCFNLLFGKFVRVFTTKEHPLVIFLDDLQWIDSASLNLLKLLLDESAAGYLLVLGAYRDNEVFPAHPLMLALVEIQKQGATLNTLTLNPLGEVDITRLIADTLLCSVKVATPLSELVYQKTQGNPFFTTQFLQGLHEEKCIQFDGEVGYWLWDLLKVRQLALTEDVVEFMVGRLHKLPEATQKVLKLAACIGNRFEGGTLAVICEATQEEVARDLWQALSEEFVLPETETYKFFQGEPNREPNTESVAVSYRFLHDRVQQAAYSLIPEELKQVTHYRIGQLLLQKTSPETREERIFELVSQLNYGTALITEPKQRDELAQLNLMAAKKAKFSTAYVAALKYLEVGIALLEGNSWNTQYDLTFSFYKELATVEYLKGNFEQSKGFVDYALERLKSPIEKGELYNLLVIQYTFIAEHGKAIDVGRKALANLDIELPENDFKSALDVEFEQINQRLESRSIESLIDLPEMRIADKKVAMKLLNYLVPPAFMSCQPLFFVVDSKAVNLSLKYGHVAESAYMYACYGILQCAIMGDYKAGYEFGILALKLSEKFNDLVQKTLVLEVLVGHLNHWGEPLTRSHYLTQDAYQAGLDSGEIQFASYTFLYQCYNRFYDGCNLQQYIEELNAYLLFSRKIKNEVAVDVILGCQLTICNLSGTEIDETIDELEHFENCKIRKTTLFICPYLIIKSQIAYLFDRLDEALNYAVEGESLLSDIPGVISIAENNFYTSVILAALYPNCPESQQKQYLAKIQSNQSRMKLWAENCPENFLHKYMLVEAEIARISQQYLDAMNLYDRAIAGAKANGYIQEAALANELAAKFYLHWGKEKFAVSYMEEAYHCYTRWGALAKTDHLQQTYPQLLTQIRQPGETFPSASNLQTFTQSLDSNTFSTSVLDLTSAIKASQALSQEIELDALLSKMMHIVLENAGADKGALILNNSGTWEIVAQCDNNNCYIFTTPLDQADTLPSTIINTVKRTQQPLLINNLPQDQTFTADPYLLQKQPKSLFCTSILNQGELLGILYLENHLTTEAFTSDRIEVLNLLTTQAAISIKNARFCQTLEAKVAERTTQLAAANAEITQLNEKLKVENLRLGAELDVARQIQQMILPKPEELESIEGLDIAGFMEPADEMGGDYYDVLETDGVITLGIGDVTGHGLESGLLMLMTQTAVRTLQEIREQDPVRFLDTLNRTLYRNVQRMNSDKNLTLAILNYSEGRVSISGQHEETLVVRSGGHIERIDTMDLGLPIGLDDDIADFIDHTMVELHPGDGVVLYTDGIPEAFNLEKKQYGLERLCEVISQNWQHNAQEIKQAVIDDLRAFIGVQKVFDDITLVILKQQ
ncbi:MAG: AAA family ATPase [Xenococcaceae cyanobacterium MO_234.B1]|nr:AAA family ATPase [Xenococcaceae cyanobacterium MO_234.B1]